MRNISNMKLIPIFSFLLIRRAQGRAEYVFERGIFVILSLKI